MAFFTVLETVLSSINFVTWLKKTKKTIWDQKLIKTLTKRLQILADPRFDLFEGVHLGREVRGFEHAQECVQPQVIYHSNQLPLEPHAE